MLKPSDSPLLVEVARLITPRLAVFGELMFGERLGRSLKVDGKLPRGFAPAFCRQLYVKGR
jgi:hypothetical protein